MRLSGGKMRDNLFAINQVVLGGIVKIPPLFIIKLITNNYQSIL